MKILSFDEFINEAENREEKIFDVIIDNSDITIFKPYNNATVEYLNTKYFSNNKSLENYCGIHGAEHGGNLEEDIYDNDRSMAVYIMLDKILEDPIIFKVSAPNYAVNNFWIYDEEGNYVSKKKDQDKFLEISFWIKKFDLENLLTSNVDNFKKIDWVKKYVPPKYLESCESIPDSIKEKLKSRITKHKFDL